MSEIGSFTCDWMSPRAKILKGLKPLRPTKSASMMG